MQKIKIIAMGHLTEDYARVAADIYLRRMSRFYQVQVIEIKPETLPAAPADGDIHRALLREGEHIIAEIPQKSAVVAMCVEGKTMPSEKFSEYIASCADRGLEGVCFIIGSSHGLSDEVKKRADMRLSVSPMTFPHELFRVLLLEQIYRAAEINRGGRYHK